MRKLSVDFAPRSYQNKENIGRCAAYIRKHFEAAGAVVTSQTYSAGSETYENVMARFGPETGKRVIVGAHYDAYDSTPGADDNASGVAGLLELARLIGAGAKPPQLRLDLVAYCTEEPPHFAGTDMGSFHHARSLAKENVEVTAMLCLEMIGYFTDAPSSQSYPIPLLKLIYPSTGNFIGIVGNTEQRPLLATVKHAMAGATDLPVYSAAMPMTVTGVDFSDHRSYWHFNYPAVMITDTAFLRNKAYHTADDTFDRLDYARMAKVVLGVHQAVRTLAWPEPEANGPGQGSETNE
ncbi:MAG: M28 family peptidase [Pirellulaceae bacterium]